MTRHIFAGMVVLLAAGALISRAGAADKQQIQQAIDQGVRYLQGMQAGDGTWPTHAVGATALAGLTLLECGVPDTDPAIQKTAEYLRRNWMDINDLYTTYAISLTILFFDRLGDPADVPIIQTLGVRLLAGQNNAGGWSYSCPSLGAEDIRKLKTLVAQQVELKAKGEVPRTQPASPLNRPALPSFFHQLLNRLERKAPNVATRLDRTFGGGGDNSNTQFAILGLWAARRHGVGVENALLHTVSRFRRSQHPDGGWGYMPTMGWMPGFGSSTPSMTCAGLLGLALGYGSAREALLRTLPKGRAAKAANQAAPPEPANDLVIRAGIVALATYVGQPIQDGGPRGRRGGDAPGDMYYTLWSIERVAVAYNLSTIGSHDWYGWGSDILLPAQRNDGSWDGQLGNDIDTCFSLLFLRRANLTPDLTAYLKKTKSLEVALKAGTIPGRGANNPRDDQGVTETGNQPSSKEAPSAKPGASKPAHVASPAAQKPADETVRASGAEPAKIPALKPADPSPPKAESRPAPPAKETASDATHLGKELVRASGASQDKTLDQLKQGKGAAYTAALADAIPQLTGAVKNKARAALAERLSRMTEATLRAKLQDEATEVRRAAALACAMKEDKKYVPDLATLLEDRQDAVVRAAHAALKELTGQDLGPADDSSPTARIQAADAWKGWWKKHN